MQLLFSFFLRGVGIDTMPMVDFPFFCPISEIPWIPKSKRSSFPSSTVSPRQDLANCAGVGLGILKFVGDIPSWNKQLRQLYLSLYQAGSVVRACARALLFVPDRNFKSSWKCRKGSRHRGQTDKGGRVSRAWSSKFSCIGTVSR